MDTVPNYAHGQICNGVLAPGALGDCGQPGPHAPHPMAQLLPDPPARWMLKLLPCPSWCIGDRAHRGEDFSEMWDIRTHEAEDLLTIRKPIVWEGEVEERDLVSVNLMCADNVTTGTREAPGIQVNVSDALSAAEVPLLVAALQEGLRILDGGAA